MASHHKKYFYCVKNFFTGARRLEPLKFDLMANDTKVQFGNRLRITREALKLSQSKLAKMLGVTTQAISIWERGGSMPQPDKWEELVKTLGCSLNWLITGKEDAPNSRTKDIVIEAVEAALSVDGSRLSASQRYDVLDRVWRSVDAKFGLSRPVPPAPPAKK